MAKLYFRYGAMNAGKSTHLLQAAYNYEERGMKILLLKPSIDTKMGNFVSSRIGLSREVDHIIFEDESIVRYIEKNDINVSCIFVDEAQFLNEFQVDELFKIAVLKDIPVICYGLRTDFQTKAFKASSRLLELAHTIEELKTICKCGKKAVFTARYIDDEFATDGSQVEIDNKKDVKYISLCGKCYYEELEKEQEKIKIKKKERE